MVTTTKTAAKNVRLRGQQRPHPKRQRYRLRVSAYIREIVYGGNDGLVTTFAVVAGFSGANIDHDALHVPIIIVLLFGIANILGDGTSMGLGYFLSVRAERDVYLSKRRALEQDLENNRHCRETITEQLFREQGYAKEHAKALSKLLGTNKEFGTEFILAHKHNIHRASHERSVVKSMIIFFSFIAFGALSLLPYGFTENVSVAFMAAIATTILGMLLLGLLRWQLTKLSPIRAFGETILVGCLAASVAFIVGTFFQ